MHEELWETAEDVGNGVRIKRFVNHDDEESGIFVMHRHEDGELCIGSVNYDTPANREAGRVVWQVTSKDPLTLSPSISQKSGPDMTECLHGHIVDGRWVPVG